MSNQTITYYDSTISSKFNNGKEYYSLPNSSILYIGTFPIEWTNINNEDETGPEYCMNCKDYGSYQGIFIGYCANCADYSYEGTRGKGFVDNGIEMSKTGKDGISIFDTYLKGIKLDDIDIHNVVDQSEITVEDIYGYIEDEEENGVPNSCVYYGSDFNGGYDSH
jgi:hypothetical protein